MYKVLCSFFLLYAKLRTFEIYWNKTSDHLLPHIKLLQKYKKRSGTSLPASSLHEEKYLSCYILLPDKISLSGCLYFVRYLEICILFACKPDCDVINFEINFFFLIKPFFLHDLKVKTNIRCLENEKNFKDERKSIINHL